MADEFGNFPDASGDAPQNLDPVESPAPPALIKIAKPSDVIQHALESDIFSHIKILNVFRYPLVTRL